MTVASLIPECICLFCAFFFLWKDNNKYWQGFIYYLLFIVMVETAGYFAGRFKVNNHWLYNFELIVEYFFIMWVFRHILLKPAARTRILLNYAGFVFIIVFILESHYHINYTTDQGHFDQLNKFSRMVAAILFVITSGWYFYELIQDAEYKDLKVHPGFWIVAAIFLYYFVSSVAASFFSKLIRIHIYEKLYISHVIYSILNIILYIFWSYSFRCRKIQRT